jgi:hypothetical protein
MDEYVKYGVEHAHCECPPEWLPHWSLEVLTVFDLGKAPGFDVTRYAELGRTQARNKQWSIDRHHERGEWPDIKTVDDFDLMVWPITNPSWGEDFARKHGFG